MNLEELRLRMGADHNFATQVTAALRDNLDYAVLRRDTLIKEITESLRDNTLNIDDVLAAIGADITPEAVALHVDTDTCIDGLAKKSELTDRQLTNRLLDSDLIDLSAPDLRTAYEARFGAYDAELLLYLNRLIHSRDSMDLRLTWIRLRELMRTAGCSGPFDTQVVGALL